MGPDGTSICIDHNGEIVTLYCALCKIAACSMCLRDRHAAHHHDVLPLAAACKAQKVSFYIFNLLLIIVYMCLKIHLTICFTFKQKQNRVFFFSSL